MPGGAVTLPTMKWLALTLGSLVLAGASACSTTDESPDDKACPAIACLNGLLLDFTLSDPGKYDLTLTSELGVVACSGALPLPACDQPQAPCSDPEVLFTASGCALSPAQQSLGGVHFTQAYPKDLTIEVKRDGSSVGTVKLSPSYVDVPPPGGEGCGPGCKQASMTVTFHQ
jgi:hypothetical protein